MKNKQNKTKKQKVEYQDDGHTVYDMSNVPQAFYNPPKKSKTPVDKEEKKSMIKAAFEVYAPIVVIIAVCFTIVMLLINLWLK